jgi:iron complex transport system substrate-binding protein
MGIANTRSVAEAISASDGGEAVIEQLQDRIDIIRHKLKFVDNRPSVTCIESLEPLMTAGNLIPEMVEIAGGKNISSGGPQSINWEDIQLHDPDIVVVMPTAFSIEQTMKEIHLLINRPGFSYLKAAKNNQVYIADDNKYSSNSAEGIVDSIEILAEIIQPKFFSFGYEGDGWIKFSV